MVRGVSTLERRGSGKLIQEAAASRGGFGPSALLEKAFVFAFTGLVYPQIWEDPVCDMEGLRIAEGDHVVTIASGGCNALSYLLDNPARVTAIDLNAAHVALNRMKQVALRELPAQPQFHRFFGQANSPENITAYHRWIAPALDHQSRAYWEGRDTLGRQRIGMFAKGFYRFGLLGTFIGLAHTIAKMHGVDPGRLLEAKNRAEQVELFESLVVPLFDKALIRALTNNPASLFGLGIPPAQYEKLAGGRKMAEVLCERLRKLCSDFDFKDNYFAWQALGQSYDPAPEASLPPYLQAQNYALMHERSHRVEVVHANMTEWLADQEAQSVNCYLFLDAQDWMTDEQLNGLWAQVCRTAAPGARVLFRTAHEDSLLPGRLDADLLAMWDYREAKSLELTATDRSSIYGGVHLYLRRD